MTLLRNVYIWSFPTKTKQDQQLKSDVHCKILPGWPQICSGTKGLRRKILSLNTLICCNIKSCRDLCTFLENFGPKSALLGQIQCFLGKKCTMTWYIFFLSLFFHFYLQIGWVWYLSRTPRIYSCKIFLAGVIFFRFNAKNWQFTVEIGNLHS